MYCHYLEDVLSVVSFVLGADDIPNRPQRGLGHSPRTVHQELRDGGMAMRKGESRKREIDLNEPPADVGVDDGADMSARPVAQVGQRPTSVTQHLYDWWEQLCEHG
jgi:hypothetical protein